MEIHQGWRNENQNGRLPIGVLSYLCAHLGMNIQEVELCWKIFENEIKSASSLPFWHLTGHLYTTEESIARLRTVNLCETASTNVSNALTLNHQQLQLF